MARYAPNIPWSFNVAIGKDGYENIRIAGRNPAIGLVFSDVWDAGILSTLNYDTQTANFTPGLLLTGGTSSATAIIVIDDDSGTTGTLTIRKITGTFQNDEIITDSSTGSATSDGLVSPILGLDYPTAGETWEIVSESPDDAADGDGARTVIVNYLDADYVEQFQIFNLTGVSRILFAASDAFRFRAASVLTWGDTTNLVYGKTNLGVIVIRDSASKNIRGVIPFDDSVTNDAHGLNNTQAIHYTIPAQKVALPLKVTVNAGKNNDVTIRVLVRLFGVEGFINVAGIDNYQNNVDRSLEDSPVALPAKSDIKIIARSDNLATQVNVQIRFLVVDFS